ncbi:MAG: sensor histidine kinase [Dokdonella sp.]
MQWIGWVVAIVALGGALWLWRKLAAERAHSAQLLYARIDAENQADTLRAQQARVLRAARSSALGDLLGEVSPQLHVPLEALQANLDTAKRQFADYRELIRRYDAAVQYCLQPVELIFGADKASLDQLMQHVEGARRKLFDARNALEKNSVHRGNSLLQGAGDALQQLVPLGRGLYGLAGPGDAHSSVDVNASLDAILDVLAARFGDQLAIVRDYQAVPMLLGGADRVNEIFLHLLDNAARAAGAGGRVTLTTRAGKGGAAVEIAIADSGDGIAEDVQPHIFEAFFTTRADDAVGLGLTIALQLVEARGGTLTLRSTRGHGTTFNVSLPVRVTSPAAPSDAPAMAAAASEPGWANSPH